MTDTRNNTSGSTSERGARARASKAYGNARGGANDAFETARQKINASPLAAVAGGVAVGAALGILLPRSQREKELLAGVGQKVTDAAREAADTAVEAGRQQVNEIKQNAMSKVGEAVVGAVISGGDGSAR